MTSILLALSFALLLPAQTRSFNDLRPSDAVEGGDERALPVSSNSFRLSRAVSGAGSPERPRVQRRTLAGTWTVEAEAVTGTLVIEKKDDKLTGSWVVGSDSTVWQLSGSVDLHEFALTTEVRETTEGPFRWTFRGENDHDTLRGTVALHRSGREPERVHKFTATRVK